MQKVEAITFDQCELLNIDKKITKKEIENILHESNLNILDNINRKYSI